MEVITTDDLILVNSLCDRHYQGNRLLSNASPEERRRLLAIRRKLKNIADYFANIYSDSYGPFETSMSMGNPVGMSTTLNNVWAGLFKGSDNKQYAAQISFVMDRFEQCLNVGFYFGRASSRNLNLEERTRLEAQLGSLGESLSDAIMNEAMFENKYNELFDLGFKAYSSENSVTPFEWQNRIRIDTSNSQITAKIYPDNFGVIENSKIDFVVAKAIFLMGAIPQYNFPVVPLAIKPLTPAQRAKQAERLSEIGQKGELFIMEYETNRLDQLNINNPNYPKHVALDSMHYGYDIISLDENEEEIFIEVKTTTRTIDDILSRQFYISINELNVYNANVEKYKLYRVYDVENNPSVEFLDLALLEMSPNGYVVVY